MAKAIPAWKQKQMEDEERKRLAAADEQRKKDKNTEDLRRADQERVWFNLCLFQYGLIYFQLKCCELECSW
jgi:hypothetical protein